VSTVQRSVTKKPAITRQAAPRRLRARTTLLLVLGAWSAGVWADENSPNLRDETIGWRTVAGMPRRLNFTTAPSIAKVEVRDAWASRYEERVTLRSGATVILEESRYPYSAQIPLQQVLYERFEEDEALMKQGLQIGIAAGTRSSFGGRTTAYYVAQGKTASCFSFVSLFAARPGAPTDRMISGQDCRPNETISTQELVRDWRAILDGIRVN
jgi:hypothetical protein